MSCKISQNKKGPGESVWQSTAQKLFHIQLERSWSAVCLVSVEAESVNTGSSQSHVLSLSLSLVSASLHSSIRSQRSMCLCVSE